MTCDKTHGNAWDRVFNEGGYDIQVPDPLVEDLLLRYVPTGQKNALDVGCGTGRHIEILKRFSISVLGLDISHRALLVSRRAHVVAPLVRGDMEHLPFPDALFDIVLAWRVLHLGNISKIQGTFFEIYRVLRPGGVFVASVRNVDNALALLLKSREEPVQSNTYQVTTISDIRGTIYHFFTDEELENLLKDLEILYMHHHELEHTRYTRNIGLKNMFTVFVARKPS